MPNVHIPAAMRSLTGGEAEVVVSGKTLGEVIDRLEERYPGLKSRMTEAGKLQCGLAALVNDRSPNTGLQTTVGPEDEIYFAPAIASSPAPVARPSFPHPPRTRHPRTPDAAVQAGESAQGPGRRSGPDISRGPARPSRPARSSLVGAKWP